jgi:hypothetical protein
METKIKIVGKMDVSKFNPPAPQFPKESIHFFMGKGKKVIGRVSSGKIAIISFDYKGKWVQDGDDWLCNIIHEDEHKVIVVPVEMQKSGIDNFNESVQALIIERDYTPKFLKNTRVYMSHK